jgi:hypothetical protein
MATNFRSLRRIEKREMIQPHPGKFSRGRKLRIPLHMERARNFTKIELQEGEVVEDQVHRLSIHANLSAFYRSTLSRQNIIINLPIR